MSKEDKTTKKYSHEEIGKLKMTVDMFSAYEAVRLGSVYKALILRKIKEMSEYEFHESSSLWIRYSNEQLSKRFPYMSKAEISEALAGLIESGELLSDIVYCPKDTGKNN